MFKKFIKIYIDDIIIFSQIFQNHLQHFRKVFILFKKLHIILNSKKSYLRFLTINFLDQKISSLKLIIIQNKIKVIIKLKFSRNLYNLEIYLELTNWLWQYILYYVYITELLQECKTLLIRQVFQKNHLWQIFVRKILMNSSSKKKLKAYQCLQTQFVQDLFLMYFNFKKIFYIDLNILKKWDFEVILFYLKEK